MQVSRLDSGAGGVEWAGCESVLICVMKEIEHRAMTVKNFQTLLDGPSCKHLSFARSQKGFI